MERVCSTPEASDVTAQMDSLESTASREVSKGIQGWGGLLPGMKIIFFRQFAQQSLSFGLTLIISTKVTLMCSDICPDN
jgi:hypothetical protein